MTTKAIELFRVQEIGYAERLTYPSKVVDKLGHLALQVEVDEINRSIAEQYRKMNEGVNHDRSSPQAVGNAENARQFKTERIASKIIKLEGEKLAIEANLINLAHSDTSDHDSLYDVSLEDEHFDHAA